MRYNADPFVTCASPLKAGSCLPLYARRRLHTGPRLRGHGSEDRISWQPPCFLALLHAHAHLDMRVHAHAHVDMRVHAHVRVCAASRMPPSQPSDGSRRVSEGPAVSACASWSSLPVLHACFVSAVFTAASKRRHNWISRETGCRALCEDQRDYQAATQGFCVHCDWRGASGERHASSFNLHVCDCDLCVTLALSV